MSTELTRRDFLQMSAAAGAISVVDAPAVRAVPVIAPQGGGRTQAALSGSRWSSVRHSVRSR